MAHTDHKIIFTGPVGAGKTTAIASISDIEPIRTDEHASDMTQKRKSNTTVAMDYGMIRLGPKEKVHLYGTPGQERFDFMWEILTEGGIALVLLIDNSRGDPLKQLRFYLGAFSGFIRKTAVAVGVTHMDLQASPSLADYQAELDRAGQPGVPVFEVDARSRRDVCLLIEAVLSVIDPVARA